MQKGLVVLVQIKLQLLQMIAVSRLLLTFKNLCKGQDVQLTQLTKDRPYTMVGACSVHGQYGPTIVFTLRSEVCRCRR